MRLIDVDSFVKELEIWHRNALAEKAELNAFFSSNFIDMVNMMPTVDAVPVRHGKWIIRDNPGTGWYRVTCSECGEDVTSTAPCIGFFPNAKVTWDYCPNCGARMVEDDFEH